MSRFRASDFADGRSSANRTVAMAPANQPYPGDGGYQTAGVDGTYTGSIQRHDIRPEASVGGAVSQPLPAPSTYPSSAARPAMTAPASSSSITRQPIAAPTTAAARPTLDRTATGSVAAPAAAPSPSTLSRTGATTITVQEGETAYNLSRRFGVPVAAILGANGLSSASDLRAGQTIVIPAYAYSGRGEAAQPRQAAVREPSPIAPTPSKPQREQRAVLPETPKTRERVARSDVNGTSGKSATGANGRYTVVSGDTLYGIARKTGVSVNNLKAANGLSEGYLQIGQSLVVPSGTVSEPVKVAAVKTPQVDTTTTSATARQPAPTAEKTVEAPKKSADTQVAAVARDSTAEAPDSTGVGKLRWPARGRVISQFGSTAGSARNDGIDIALPAGSAVKSAENGVVIYAGDGLKEFGNTVLVRHDDGMVTVYGHASALKVKRGDKVRRGQEIALSGMSGNADTPKLHFEVRKDATPVNPIGYLE